MTEVVTLESYNAAFDAALDANTVDLTGTGTQMSWIMYTDPIYGMDSLWTMVGRKGQAADWGDQDWQATVTLEDQTEGSSATSSWTCRMQRSGLVDAAWTTEAQMFASAGAAITDTKGAGVLTEQGGWSDALQWGSSVWMDEIKADAEQKMADAAAAAAEAAAAETAGDEAAGDEAAGDEVTGDEAAGDEATDDTGDEGTDDTGDEAAADEVVEAEPSLKEQFMAEKEGMESWGWDAWKEEGEWMLWCGGWRDVTGVEGDFDLVEGATVGVTVTWTDITVNAKNSKITNTDPVTTETTITLAKADLPSLEPPVVEETDEGTETEEGDSATFIKATSVALGAFAVMLA